MPWYWTDDLARTLIDAGEVDRTRVAAWLASPVAIRREEGSPADIAGSLLEDEGEPSSAQAAVAA